VSLTHSLTYSLTPSPQNVSRVLVLSACWWLVASWEKKTCHNVKGFRPRGNVFVFVVATGRWTVPEATCKFTHNIYSQGGGSHPQQSPTLKHNNARRGTQRKRKVFGNRTARPSPSCSHLRLLLLRHPRRPRAMAVPSAILTPLSCRPHGSRNGGLSQERESGTKRTTVVVVV